MREDRRLLVTFLPGNWKEHAVRTGGRKGLPKDKSAPTELSLVAQWMRLEQSCDWLRVALFRERGVDPTERGGR